MLAYMLCAFDMVAVRSARISKMHKSETLTTVASKTESIYGARFEEDWPTTDCKITWTQGDVQGVIKPTSMDLEVLMTNSSKFPIPFPLDTARCQYLKTKVAPEELSRNMNSTYPVLHEKVLELYLKFIKHKTDYGSQVEKNLYKEMSITQFVDRLLRHRAVSFWGPNDKWQLLSKKSGIAGWDKVGTEEEQEPLTLKDVISYDEIKLSAFLYISGYTYFVNNGNRNNCGVLEPNRSSVEEEGVIIGLIGARLKRRHVMEYEDIIITKEQNSAQNGFTKETPTNATLAGKQKWRILWANFYEEQINTYSAVEAAVKKAALFKQICQYYPAKAKNAYFDNMYYKKRLSIAFDSLLFEANHRAGAASKMAFIHMVGIGLGVWRNAEHQEPAFLEVFLQRLEELRQQTHNIADVHFAYFHTRPTDKVKDGMIVKDPTHPQGGVKLHISKREPSSRLSGEHAGKLLVAAYAWDGNAQPGNEYWCNMLKSTGDSATACSTQVAELHNAHINKQNVCGNNLHIASKRYGVLHYAQYLKKCQEK